MKMALEQKAQRPLFGSCSMKMVTGRGDMEEDGGKREREKSSEQGHADSGTQSVHGVLVWSSASESVDQGGTDWQGCQGKKKRLVRQIILR